MSMLPEHFDSYRANAAKAPNFGAQRTCTRCRQRCPQLGGKNLARPGSCRRDWICATCALLSTA